MLISLVFMSASSQAQNPYITVWQTDDQWGAEMGNPINSSADNQINIPAEGSFTYTWEELDEQENPTSNTGSGAGENQTIIDFPHPGRYRLKITPSGENPFHTHKFFPYSLGDPGKIIRVEQWGDIEWSSFQMTFLGTKNLEITAEDTPDLSQTSDMAMAFMDSGISEINNINNWDVSSVQYMNGLFHSAQNFNSPIGNWDVGNVIEMTNMFNNAGSFNQPIESWNTGNVTDISAMFSSATAFNQPIGNWDVSNVTNMNLIFSGAQNFDQPIGDWNVGQVVYMFGMFQGASSFNQPIGNWNVSNVTAMDAMFLNAENFNQPIGDWDTGNVEDMGFMFSGAINFNQPIGNWNVANVLRMKYMFSYTQNFNQNLTNWNVSNVYLMQGMFRNSIFNMPIEKWDVSSVIRMDGMFMENPHFNQSLEGWNFSNVGYIAAMFAYTSNFNQPLNNWDVSNVVEATGIFHGASSFNQPLPDWNLEKLIVVDNWLGVFEEENSFSFSHSGMSCENYSLTLKGWANNPDGSTRPLIMLSEGMEYSTEIEEDRFSLEQDFNWTIIGDAAGSCTLDLEKFDLAEIRIYPNPTKDIVMIDGGQLIEQIEILDLSGKLIFSYKNSLNEDKIKVNLQDFSKDVYFLKIGFIDGNRKTERIIKH